MGKIISSYYLPKQIMTSDYASFSVESKLLFAMIFTNSEHIKTITETAQLIEKIGEKEMYNMRRLLDQAKNVAGESEGA